MKTWKHLTFEQRKVITNGISRNYKLKEIAEAIGCDPTSISKEVKRNREDRDLDKEERNFYKEQRDDEEKVLLKAIEQIQTIVKVEELNYDYKEKNHRTYSVVTVDRNLTTIEKSQIKAQIDSNFYHIEIDDNENGKNIIEVHLKNPISLDLEKGKNNV